MKTFTFDIDEMHEDGLYEAIENAQDGSGTHSNCTIEAPNALAAATKLASNLVPYLTKMMKEKKEVNNVQ